MIYLPLGVGPRMVAGKAYQKLYSKDFIPKTFINEHDVQ